MDEETRSLALDFIHDAINLCPNEILLLDSENVVIMVPKWFINLITENYNNDVFFQGYKVKIGYEHSIVIFNENNMHQEKVFKHKIK